MSNSTFSDRRAITKKENRHMQIILKKMLRLRSKRIDKTNVHLRVKFLDDFKITLKKRDAQ